MEKQLAEAKQSTVFKYIAFTQSIAKTRKSFLEKFNLRLMSAIKWAE